MIYLKLFWDFFRVSCFTFGGAYGAIPLIRDMVLANGWLSDERITYMIAVSESTPGPIMVNMATYVGSSQAGIPGALAATLGMVVPSFAVIYLISMFLDNFLELTLIANAFRGIKIAVGILILDAGITMVKKMHKKKLPRTIMACSCAVMLWVNIFARNFSSISLMLIAAAVSLAVFVLKGAPGQKGGGKG